MKIFLLGTGDVYSSRLSSCFLIDDVILVDIPNGALKQIKKYALKPESICIQLITHYHADHFFDLPFLFLEKNRCNNNTPTIVIGPKGLHHHIDSILNLAYPDLDWSKIKANIGFRGIELDKEKETIQIGDYKITGVQVSHGKVLCYGYLIEDGNKSVSFTGDSILCPSVKYLVKNSKICFVDTSFKKTAKTHMGMNDINILRKTFLKFCKIFPVHTSDEVLKIYRSKNAKVIKEGTIIKI